MISFRNNVRDFGFIDCFGTYENRYFRVSFLDNGSSKEYTFYITPFCDIDGKRYTSENTFKFYTKNEIDEEGLSVQNLYVEMYLFDNGEFVLSGDPQVIASEYGVVRYVELLFGFTSTANLHFHSYNYKLYKDFMSSTARTDSTYNPDQLVVNFDPQYSSLLLYNSYPDDSINIFNHVYHYNASNCVISSHKCSYDYCDLGFVRTAELPVFNYAIDIEKIPDNYYITVGGDTIYDYNITNPSTGDTTTINNYITNNYTYITNPGDVSGSGSTVNNYYDGAIINNGDNHYYDGASINNGDNHYYEGATINNGDNITNNYNFSEGDTNFFTQIGIEIQNAMNFAFVPSDGFMDSFNIDLRNALESKMPFVYDIGDIFDALFVDIVDDNLVYVSDINSDGSVDESSIIYPK